MSAGPTLAELWDAYQDAAAESDRTFDVWIAASRVRNAAFNAYVIADRQIRDEYLGSTDLDPITPGGLN